MDFKRKNYLDKTIDMCKKAYGAHIPVIYLCTDQIELVDEILKSNRLVPRRYSGKRMLGQPLNAKDLFFDDGDITDGKKLVECLINDSSKDIRYLREKIPSKLLRDLEDLFLTEESGKQLNDELDKLKKKEDLCNKALDNFLVFLNNEILKDIEFPKHLSFEIVEKVCIRNKTDKKVGELFCKLDPTEKEVMSRNRFLLENYIFCIKESSISNDNKFVAEDFVTEDIDKREELVKRLAFDTSRHIRYFREKMPVEVLQDLKKAFLVEVGNKSLREELEMRKRKEEERRMALGQFLIFLNEQILADPTLLEQLPPEKIDRISTDREEKECVKRLFSLCRKKSLTREELMLRNRILLEDHILYALEKNIQWGDIDEIKSSNHSYYDATQALLYNKTLKTDSITVLLNFSQRKEEAGVKQLGEYVRKYVTASLDAPIRKHLLMLVDSNLYIPTGLDPYIEIVKVPHLEEWEIENIVTEYVGKKNSPEPEPNRILLDEVVIALKGFTKWKILEVLRKIEIEIGGIFVNCDGAKNEEGKEYIPIDMVRKIVTREKEQMLSKSGVLTNEEVGNEEIGGFGNFIEWLGKRSKIFRNIKNAKDFWSIYPPKGVLITGIPGSGKSLMAKITAKKLGLPLIRMDVGALMGRYVGESEENMRKAIDMAEAMAPCVLWVDELDKGFSGAGSNDGQDSSGSFKRMFASFLTWMQEKKDACMVFATANDISLLPPELFRSGRFAQKYYTFMPTAEECADIFWAKLCSIVGGNNEYGKYLFDIDLIDKESRTQNKENKKMDDTKKWFIKLLNDCCGDKNKFLIGADVEEIIKNAMIEIYSEEKEMDAYEKDIVRYKKEKFEDALKKAMKDIRAFGETNFKDIARCFIQCSQNNFSPVNSTGAIIPLDCYNPNPAPRENDTKNPYENAISMEKPQQEGNYNIKLYKALRDEINKQTRDRLVAEDARLRMAYGGK